MAIDGEQVVGVSEIPYDPFPLLVCTKQPEYLDNSVGHEEVEDNRLCLHPRLTVYQGKNPNVSSSHLNGPRLAKKINFEDLKGSFHHRALCVSKQWV